MDLTILTEPVSIYGYGKEIIKGILGKHRKYGGHYAVTRSLIEGLQGIGYKGFNYRPQLKSQIYENVHVLSGVSTLKYAIELKRKGKIKHLSAGPNVVVFPTDYNKLICNDSIDLYLQPCEWAVKLHIDMAKELAKKCFSWAAGVNIHKFKPSRDRNGNNILIYYKEGSRQFMWYIDYLMRERGFHTHIIEYGNYQLEDYMELLSKVSLMVVIGGKESQGLFLAEAWAMDIPTVCYEINYYCWENYNRHIEISGNNLSCPYLSSETGETFSNAEELCKIIDNWDRISKKEPRRWVVENMTDEICSHKFIEMLEEYYGYR